MRRREVRGTRQLDDRNGPAGGRCATLCYMDRVGIRELRQNLSVHLRRVKRGDSLEVTEHGRPVALLAPLPQPAAAREQLLASGKLTPARSGFAELGAPPPPLRSGRPASEALDENRADRV